MRSGAAADHAGYYHETAFYSSDDEFVATVVPFLQDGIAVGEPVLVACGPHNARLLRRALTSSEVRFLSGPDQYAQPGPAIRSYRSIFDDLVAQGAEQIRVIGDVPHPGLGADWQGWLRYEAAANEAYRDFPIWGICPYDTRITPVSILADVVATHPHIADPSGARQANANYRDGRAWLTQHSSRRERIEPADPPAIIVVDPTPRAARHALAAVAKEFGFDPAKTADLLTAASEAVTNALVHGQGPVTLTAWHHDGRITACVHDQGKGPTDPLAGLLPPEPDRTGGRGLWLVHQLCGNVRMSYAAGYTIGFTVSRDRE